jgi:hypothetical protein
MNVKRYENTGCNDFSDKAACVVCGAQTPNHGKDLQEASRVYVCVSCIRERNPDLVIRGRFVKRTETRRNLRHEVFGTTLRSERRVPYGKYGDPQCTQELSCVKHGESHEYFELGEVFS